MKQIYAAISIVLVFSAFQGAPVLAGEGTQTTQTYVSSHQGISAGWERPTAPFSFSPAPPSGQVGTRGGSPAMKASAAGISSDGYASEGRLTASREDLQTPMGFSPAPPLRHEGLRAGRSVPAPPSSLSAKGQVSYQNVRASAHKGGAPLGFFPVVGNPECEYRSC